MTYMVLKEIGLCEMIFKSSDIMNKMISILLTSSELDVKRKQITTVIVLKCVFHGILLKDIKIL